MWCNWWLKSSKCSIHSNSVVIELASKEELVRISVTSLCGWWLTGWLVPHSIQSCEEDSWCYSVKRGTAICGDRRKGRDCHACTHVTVLGWRIFLTIATVWAQNWSVIPTFVLHKGASFRMVICCAKKGNEINAQEEIAFQQREEKEWKTGHNYSNSRKKDGTTQHLAPSSRRRVVVFIGLSSLRFRWQCEFSNP